MLLLRLETMSLERLRGSMGLSAALWSRLPFEMVEQILSFLPVPDLCRHRIVCKAWNRLICSPKFGAAHARNAALRDASFIVLRYTLQHDSAPLDPLDSTHVGWCFLDVAARRWCTVKDVDQQIDPRNFFSKAVAMNGGLVCQYLETDSDSEGDSIIVYKPIAKTLKELPPAPIHQTSQLYPKLKLVVDTIAQQFKVFLINQNILDSLDDDSTTPEERLEILSDPLMRVYDSVSNEWKSPSTNPSCVASSGVGRVSSVMFQGLLYCLIGSDPDLDEQKTADHDQSAT